MLRYKTNGGSAWPTRAWHVDTKTSRSLALPIREAQCLGTLPVRKAQFPGTLPARETQRPRVSDAWTKRMKVFSLSPLLGPPPSPPDPLVSSRPLVLRPSTDVPSILIRAVSTNALVPRASRSWSDVVFDIPHESAVSVTSSDDNTNVVSSGDNTNVCSNGDNTNVVSSGDNTNVFPSGKLVARTIMIPHARKNDPVGPSCVAPLSDWTPFSPSTFENVVKTSIWAPHPPFPMSTSMSDIPTCLPYLPASSLREIKVMATNVGSDRFTDSHGVRKQLEKERKLLRELVCDQKTYLDNAYRVHRGPPTDMLPSTSLEKKATRTRELLVTPIFCAVVDLLLVELRRTPDQWYDRVARKHKRVTEVRYAAAVRKLETFNFVLGAIWALCEWHP